MKEQHYYIFTLCTKTGGYDYVLVLSSEEHIVHHPHTRYEVGYVEYVENGVNKNAYYLDVMQVYYTGTPLKPTLNT